MKPKSSVDRGHERARGRYNHIGDAGRRPRILCPQENISRVRSQIAPQPKPVCRSLLFARKPTPNLFGIAFRFCNASLPGGAMLRLEHLAFPFVLASQSRLRGLSTRV